MGKSRLRAGWLGKPEVSGLGAAGVRGPRSQLDHMPIAYIPALAHFPLSSQGGRSLCTHTELDLTEKKSRRNRNTAVRFRNQSICPKYDLQSAFTNHGTTHFSPISLLELQEVHPDTLIHPAPQLMTLGLGKVKLIAEDHTASRLGIHPGVRSSQLERKAKAGYNLRTGVSEWAM